MLKPQDVCLLLKIVARGPEPWSYSQLAWELAMSASEVHAGMKRAADAGLLRLDGSWGVPDAQGLDELLVHGVRYVWSPVRGSLVQGMPTGAAAPPLSGMLPASDDPPSVWPDPDGAVRGIAFEPLYKSVPMAARRDPALYELLVLVDAIRGGPERAREVAVRQLRRRLGTDHAPVLTHATSATRSRHVSTSTGSHGKERQRVHR